MATRTAMGDYFAGQSSTGLGETFTVVSDFVLSSRTPIRDPVKNSAHQASGRVVFRVTITLNYVASGKLPIFT